MTPINRQDISAVILAGGMGRRMGGADKGQVRLRDQLLIEYVIQAIQPQVATVLINANRNQAAYAHYGFDVISDALENYQGPLAGFAAGMGAAPTAYIVTVPCDGPLLAPDLVTRLTTALLRDKSEIAVAHDGKRLQPVYALLPVRLLPSLTHFLDSGQRKIDRWYAQHSMALADFSDVPHTFMNINTPEDQRQLETTGLPA